MISETLIQTMKTYFMAETKPFNGLGLKGLDAEKSTYVWPKTYPNIQKPVKLDGLNIDLEKSKFHQNIKLKEQISKLWMNGDKRIIAEWIVRNWGGIKGNRPETLDRYVSIIQNNNGHKGNGGFGKQIKGVASYSKILMATNPEKYAIYDARVAVSLNAIQLIDKTENGLAFNYLSGRNRITGDNSKKRGFSSDPKYKVASLIKTHGFSRIQRDGTYGVYLDLLHKVKTHFPDYKLYHLEMALFADAEALVLKVKEA